MRSLVRMFIAALVVVAPAVAAVTVTPSPASAATMDVCGNAAADQAVATGRYVVTRVYSNRSTCSTTANYATFTLQSITAGQTRLTVCGTRTERFIPAAWFVTSTISYDTPPCDLGTIRVTIEPITRRGSFNVCGNTAADKAVNSGRYFITRVYSNPSLCRVTGNNATFYLEQKYVTHTAKSNICATTGGRWIPAGWVVVRAKSYNQPPCELGTGLYDIRKL